MEGDNWSEKKMMKLVGEDEDDEALNFELLRKKV